MFHSLLRSLPFFLVINLACKSVCCLGYDEVSLLGHEWEISNANRSIHLVGRTLPGDVYNAVFDGRLENHPYFRSNDLKQRWISYDNWTYTKLFTLERQFLQSARIVILEMSGVDTFSSVVINGFEIGKTSNMFGRFYFEVPPAILRALNRISLAFVSPVLTGRSLYAEHVIRRGYFVPPKCNSMELAECHANYVRKMQASFAWDWGPAFPTMGLANGDLKARRNLELIHNLAGFRVAALTILSNHSGTDQWTINVESFLSCSKNVRSSKLDASIHVAVPELNLQHDEGVRLVAGENMITISLHVNASLVKLWWPNGYGEQMLYNVSVKIVIRDNVVTSSHNRNKLAEVSQQSSRFAFRTVELVQDPVLPNTTTNNNNQSLGLSFFFRINSVPIFLKGANWIPADSFLASIGCGDRLRFYFRSLKSAHANAIRVWGGGVYESDCFYDFADEFGVMIWQDFMFACAMYPANAEFLDNVRREVQYQLRRLKSHPAIIAWAGNNENELALVDQWFPSNATEAQLRQDYLLLYRDTIGAEVQKADFTRPFLLSSPSNGKQTVLEGGISKNPGSNLFGDVHFYNYDDDAWNPETYPKARCVTEFGFQSLPSFETLAEVLDAGDFDFFGEQMQHRQRHPNGTTQLLLQIASQMKLPKMLSSVSNLQWSAKLKLKFTKAMIYLSQIHQAIAIKTQTETYRRNRYFLDRVTGEGLTMCALYWQLNDIWQGVSWSSIDYSMRWKMLQYYSVKFFAPVLVSPFIDRTTDRLLIFVVSDVTKSLHRLQLTINAIHWRNFEPVETVPRILEIDQISSLGSALVYETNLSSFLFSLSCTYAPLSYADFIITVQLSSVETGESLSENIVFPEKLAFVPTTNFGQAKIVSIDFVDRYRFFNFSILISADSVAPFVWLSSGRIQGQFSDNGFTMTSPSVQVYFYASNETTLEHLRRKLTLTSLGDLYR